MDFTIQFGLKTENSYAVTATAPGGQSGSGLFVLPVDGYGEPLHTLDWRDEPDAKQLGSALYQALFQGPIGRLWQESCGAADHAGESLDLHITLHPTQPGVLSLLGIPWELLFDPDREEFIALSWKRSVSRHIAVERPLPPLPRPPILRILGAFADPDDQQFLDVEAELQVLGKAGPRRDLEVRPIRPAHLGEVTVHFENDDVHVLHFIGHGDFDEKSQTGELLFRSPDGSASPIDSRQLGAALAGIDSLRLIVLNACSTARMPSAPGANPFAGVATALVKAGIPAVVAMQLPLGDQEAITFAGTLYRLLLAGKPLERAMTLARRAIRDQELGSMAWAIPVLYTRVPGAVLFTPTVSDAAAGQALRHYLERIADLHRHLDLPSPSWLKAPPVAAADLFVEPRCRKLPSGTSRGEAAAPFDEVAMKERHLAILGEAGSGKTMLLRRLAVDLASRASQGPAEDAAFSFPGLIPVLIAAADLAAERGRSPSDLASCLGRCVSRLPGLEKAEVRALATVLPDLLDDGRAVLLIDGLDEAGDPRTRLDLLQELDRLAQAPGPRLVVTSRTASWPAPYRSDRITRVVLEPFGAEEIGRFLAAWNRSLGGPVDLEPIGQWIERQKDRSLVECPWFLSLLCWLIQQGRKRIPRCRTELYAFVIDVLLDKEIPHRLPLRKAEALELLAAIASRAQERGEYVDARQVQRLVERRISPTAAPPSPAEISRALLDDLGILTPQGRGFYRFWHMGFQEYFAACFLEPEIRSSVDRLLERMAEPYWREPLRMAMGCSGFDELGAPSRLEWLRSLIAHEDPQDPGAPRPALFLAATLVEMPEAPEELVEELAERLLACMAADTGRPAGKGPLVDAFLRLLEGNHAVEARNVLSEALSHGDGPRALAAARLVRQAGPLAGDAVDALPNALRHDEAGLDRPVEAALRDLAAQDPERLPSPSGSLRESLRRREDLTRNVVKDPAWLRLILAVYGGFSPGSGFHTERIHRNSPLTRLLLRALETNDPPNSLIPELERLLSSSEPDAPFDAALALLALSGPALEKIPKDFFADERRQARLAHFRAGLRPLAAAALAPCLEGLGQLASRCDPERWSALLAALLRTGVAWGAPPAALFRLGSAGSMVPPAARSAVLAEIWHVPLVSQDPIYHFTLLLDLMGGALSSPPWLLADSLARAGSAVLARATRYRGWNLQALEERPRSRRETLAAALDSLAALASPFDFVRGWALARLAPLLAEEGLLSPAIHLADESLSDHFEARQDALATLRAHLGRPVVPAAPKSFPSPLHSHVPSDDTPLLLEHASDLTRPNGAGAPLLLAALLSCVPSEGLPSESIDATSRSPAGPLVSRGVLPLDLSLRWDGVPAEQAVSPLLDSLEATDDLRRHEALLALAGDRSDSQQSASAAALGATVLSRLAHEWLAHREYRPRTAQIIDWTLERVRHDDGEALAAWGHRLEHEQAMHAEVLLSRIHDLHPRAWPAFRDLLHTDFLPLQRALLQSLCYLAARRRLSLERWDEIADALGRRYGEAAQQEVFFPEGPLAIAQAVEVAFETGANKEFEATITAVEGAVLPFVLPLFCKIDLENPKAILERLAAAGSIRITPTRRRETVALAADRLARRPEALPILLAWMVHRLKRGPRDPSPFCPVTGSLLGVAAAVADRVPDDFRRAATQISDFDQCLHQAAEAHDSYFGRRAALEILACLGRLTPATVTAVRSALRDVPECQATILAAASAFDSASSPAVKELAQALSDPSALTALVAAAMATALARSGSLQSKERNLLAEEARKALATSEAKEVWTLAIDGKLVRPLTLGRLDESLFNLLLELAGLGLLRRKETTQAPNIEGEMKGAWLNGEINGRRERLPIHIGRPALGLDPLKYQKAWMTEVLGARILFEGPSLGLRRE